ncbi:MerR family transcriptional regulator [Glaciimonas sp. PAMC28666]|uniref:MerR family transcriptional regulator n=1 Tax=Glaciimonas sp. PAMC28666 TaxID=2807626 RepID=UPI00351C5650
MNALDFERTLTTTLDIMTSSLTIQQAATATGLTAHTLRYYERIGLIDPIPRQDNKHRLYRDEDILWIGFLLKLRSTGLPIRKMLRYAELRRTGNQQESVSERKALLEQHTLSLEATLADLKSNLSVMYKKIAMYADIEKTFTARPVINTFEKEHRHEHN